MSTDIKWSKIRLHRSVNVFVCISLTLSLPLRTHIFVILHSRQIALTRHFWFIGCADNNCRLHSENIHAHTDTHRSTPTPTHSNKRMHKIECHLKAIKYVYHYLLDFVYYTQFHINERSLGCFWMYAAKLLTRIKYMHKWNPSNNWSVIVWNCILNWPWLKLKNHLKPLKKSAADTVLFWILV